MSWTRSSGQLSDSVRCYTLPQLRKIATIVTQKSECDTMLEMANKRLEFKDLAIENFRQEMYNYQDMLRLKDTIIGVDNAKMDELRHQLKMTKIMWYTSSGILISFVVLLIL